MSAEETLALLVLSVSAFLAPLLAGRLGLPGAVVEISCGMAIVAVVGPLGTGGLVRALAEIGFAVLMFLAGMEIDLHDALAAGRRNLIGSILAVVAIFAIALLAANRLGMDRFYALLGGAISIGVAVAVLRERGLLRQPIGQSVLLVGGLGELATIIALAVSTVEIKYGLSWHAARELAGLGLLFVFAIAFLIGLRELVWWFPHHLARLIQSHDPAEIGPRAALALLFSFVALSRALGVEMVLAAFLAGAAFGFIFRQKAALEEKLSAAGYGFFIPIFFVNVGLNLRLGEVLHPEYLLLIGQLALVTFVARLPVVPLIRLAGLPWRSSIAVTLLLSAPLTLQVAIATTGQDLGKLDAPTASAAIFFASLAGLVYPVLARRVIDHGTKSRAPTMARRHLAGTLPVPEPAPR